MKNDKDRFVKQPNFPGGMEAMKKFVTEHLRYPEQALEAKIEGAVSLRFDIDNKGAVSNVQVQTGIGHGCDEEAKRIIGLMKFQTQNPRGLRITYHKNLQIHFRLSSENTQIATLNVEDISEHIISDLPQQNPTPSINYNYIATPKSLPHEAPTPSQGYVIRYTIG